MSTVIQLSQPIKAHGDEVSILTLRAPTTKDVIEIGLPTLIVIGDDGQSTGVEVRQKIVARYISRLAQIPMGSVESLSLKDHSLCSAAVMRFFGTGDGETPQSETPES